MQVDLAVPADFSLSSTVLSHGFVQTAPFSWDGAALRRIDRMKPGGRPYRVEITQQGRTLRLQVHAARRIPDAYVARVRRMLQIDLSLRAFHRAIAGEAHLRWIKRGKYGRVLRTGDLFEDVTKALCGTNVQWTQAVKMANVICTLGPRLGDGHAFPTPDEVVRAGAKWLKAHARVGYRAEYIIHLAEHLDEALENDAPSLTGVEIRKRLQAMRGIGPSTARYLSAFFGRYDAVSVDSAVISYASRAYFKGKVPTTKQVERHFARYGDHRALVSWFEVWKDWRDRHDVPV